MDILCRSLWWIALVVIGTLVLTAVVLHSIDPRFQAQAVLQMAERLPPLPSNSPTAQQSAPIDDLSVNSEIDAIYSPPVLRRVVKQLQLDKDPEFNPSLSSGDAPVVWQAIFGLVNHLKNYLRPNTEVIGEGDTRLVEERLAKATTVSVKGRSRIIVIEVSSLRADKAAAIANAIADAFFQNRLDAKLAYTKRLTAWLDGRLGELRSRVTQSQAALGNLRTSVGQYAGQTTAPVLTEQLSQIARQLVDAQAEQGRVSAKVDQLGRLSKSNFGVRASDDVLASALIANLQQQKAQLDTQRQEVQSRLGPKHPDVKSITSQISQIDAEIAGETGRITHNAADQLKEINTRVARLEQAKSAIEKKIDTQGVSLVRLSEMQAQAHSDRKAYEAFAIYRDKVAGLTEVEQPAVQLLSAAIPPISPSYPRDFLTLAAAGCISLLLSMAYALLRPSFDTRFRSAQDVAVVLGLPNSRERPADIAQQAPRSSRRRGHKIFVCGTREYTSVAKAAQNPFHVVGPSRRQDHDIDHAGAGGGKRRSPDAADRSRHSQPTLRQSIKPPAQQRPRFAGHAVRDISACRAQHGPYLPIVPDVAAAAIQAALQPALLGRDNENHVPVRFGRDQFSPDPLRSRRQNHCRLRRQDRVPGQMAPHEARRGN